VNIFEIFGKKATQPKGISDIPDITQMADQLLKEGKISAEQASKLKDWDSIRPDAKTSPEKFASWMKLKPDITIQQTTEAPATPAAPVASKPAEPVIPGQGLDFPDIGEMADKLANSGKISQMQAFQLKTWASVMPDKNASPAKWEAWKKAKPDVDIPGL
jgi:hypothetical protein